MPKSKKFTKSRVQQAIRDSGTLKSMAKSLNVTPRTIRNYLDEYDLWDDFQSNKTIMMMIAASNVNESLEDGDIDTSKWVLERLGKQQGWNRQLEISGVLGQLELTPEQIQILENSGLNLSDVVQNLIGMLQAAEETSELDEDID